MLTTVKKMSRIVVSMLAALIALCGFSTAPAHAEDKGNPMYTTVLVDVSWVAKNSTWMSDRGDDMRRDIHGIVQVSGFYADTQGDVVTSAIALSANHWRVRAAIEQYWYDQYVASATSSMIRRMMQASLKLGKITIESITISDYQKFAGVDAKYSVVATNKIGYALIRPNRPFKTQALPVVNDDLRLGAKYFVAIGRYDGVFRYASVPIMVTSKAIGTDLPAYNVRGALLSEITTAIGGVVVNESKEAIAVISEDPASDGGTLLALSNASLRQFMTEQGLQTEPSPTSTPSEPTTKPSVSQSASPSATPVAPSASSTPTAPQPPASSDDLYAWWVWVVSIVIVAAAIVVLFIYFHQGWLKRKSRGELPEIKWDDEQQ